MQAKAILVCAQLVARPAEDLQTFLHLVQTEERFLCLLCLSSQFASTTDIFGACIVQVALWNTWEDPTLHATLHAYNIQS